MTKKLTIKYIFLEPALHIQGKHIELHRLSRKERKMTCRQNPGPGNNIIIVFIIIIIITLICG